MDDTKLERLLSVDETPIDSAAGLRRFRDSIQMRGLDAYRSPSRGRWTQALAAAAAVTVLFAGLQLTGVAGSFLTIFQPKQVAPLTIGAGDLTGLPDLSEFGTLTITTQPAYRQAATLELARTETGLTPLRAATLPAGVTGDARIYTVSRGEGTFQFDESKLRTSAGRVSRTPPPMPAGIAASTLNVAGGPAIVQTYGGSFDPKSDARLDPKSAPKAMPGSVPTLLIAQSKAPVIRSDGAGVDELRAYMLSQPGISPQLAAQVRAIGDPAQTLLVPIPGDLASGKSVTVRGVRGVFVGDSTGIGSAVVWVADGVVHIVAGTLGERELLAVADSLR